MAPAALAYELKPGETVEYQAELPPGLRNLAGGGQPSEVARALCAVAVPQDFDAAKIWPVLVISATSDAKYSSSRRLMARFTAPALAAGWVVVAADPDHAVGLEGDTNSLRYALIKTALAALQLKWAVVVKSPLAFGGFSGGAKRAAWMAAMAVIDAYRPIGVFQGGCNEAAMADALKAYSPDRRAFLAIPVFLSSGREDPIATPEDHERVKGELVRTGFRHVRLESWSGQHALNPAHVTAALKWFTSLAAAPAKP